MPDKGLLLKLAYGIFGTVLFATSLFFAVIVVYLVSTEIMPAIEKGSFGVESSTMILNVLWEGNEIYIVLTAYVLLAGAFAYGAVRAIKKVIQ